MTKKAGLLLLLLGFCVTVAGCYVQEYRPTGAVGPAPGYYEPAREAPPAYDNPPPTGAVGPAPEHHGRGHVTPDNDYPPPPPPPPPPGAVGPAW